MTGPIRIGAVYIKPEHRPPGYQIHKWVTENGASQEALFYLSGFAKGFNENGGFDVGHVALKYTRAA